MKKIKVNKIKCKHCGDTIESTYVWDYKQCSCKTVSVDGGKEYLKRGFKNSPEIDYEDLSEVEEENAKE